LSKDKPTNSPMTPPTATGKKRWSFIY